MTYWNPCLQLEGLGVKGVDVATLGLRPPFFPRVGSGAAFRPLLARLGPAWARPADLDQGRQDPDAPSGVTGDAASSSRFGPGVARSAAQSFRSGLPTSAPGGPEAPDKGAEGGGLVKGISRGPCIGPAARSPGPRLGGGAVRRSRGAAARGGADWAPTPGTRCRPPTSAADEWLAAARTGGNITFVGRAAADSRVERKPPPRPRPRLPSPPRSPRHAPPEPCATTGPTKVPDDRPGRASGDRRIESQGPPPRGIRRKD